MSVYPHTQSQMSYSLPGYGAHIPAHVLPTNPHFHPPPVPQPYYDPNTFRRDYMAGLSTLTVNSRPIIQSLSMIAQREIGYADVVASCLEQHIRRVPPWVKLPSFYLLDAISKNVYEPYARHFTPVVVRLFLDTYEVVDQTTRSKMEEMLITWRSGAPNGRELFGVVVQLAIERHIWGSDASQNASGSRSAGTTISSAQVLSELVFVLGQMERVLQTNPHDTVTQNHIGVLQQLRKLVQDGVSQAELGQILTQLRTLTTPAASVSPPPPPPVLQSYAAAPPSYASLPVVPASAPQHAYSLPSSSYLSTFEQPKTEPIDLSRLLSTPVPSMSSTPAVPDIANLFSALVKAGVVSATGTPTGAGASSKPAESSKPLDPEREAARAYRRAVFSHKVKLTSADITRQRPSITHILYDSLPTQCKHCGARFAENHVGKKRFEDHLDMHFRQNRKASQAVGRGHSRSWFISLEDWIHGDSIDVKGKGRADGRSVKLAAAEEAAKREAELRAMFVVVPPGDEAKAISCPICKETLKSEFLEDDEDWVWRNAIKKEERIYHATCHAEAITSKSSLAVRLRNETSGRSRSRTPEIRTPPKVNGDVRKSETPTPSPSKLAGMKRKAEVFDSAGSVKSLGDAPQAKRVAT